MTSEEVSDLYMLDTNIFDRIVKGTLDPQCLAGRRVIATLVQRSELAQTPDPELRARLLALFDLTIEVPSLSAAFSFGIDGAGLGQAYWCADPGLVNDMLNKLEELDRQRGKTPKPENQMRDANLAYTAMKAMATLMTADRNLAEVVRLYGAKVELVGPAVRE